VPVDKLTGAVTAMTSLSFPSLPSEVAPFYFIWDA